MSSIEVFAIFSARPLNFVVMSRRKRTARPFGKRIKGTLKEYYEKIAEQLNNAKYCKSKPRDRYYIQKTKKNLVSCTCLVLESKKDGQSPSFLLIKNNRDFVPNSSH